MPTSTSPNSALMTGSKFFDFIVGFFGTYIVGTALNVFILPIMTMLTPMVGSTGTSYLMSFVLFALFLAILAIYIWLIRYSFRKGYKVLGYGMITSLLLPLLLFGACLGVLSTMKF